MKNQYGHAMTSWLATGIFVWIILFVPITGDKSAAELLENSIKKQYIAEQMTNGLP